MAIARVCTFCGKEIETGTGKMYVALSGAISFYCSSKCEKNVALGRSSRKVKWTEAYRKEKLIRTKSNKPAESVKSTQVDANAEKLAKKPVETPKKASVKKVPSKAKASEKVVKKKA
jgi:large subunit ribosomal protein L24e